MGVFMFLEKMAGHFNSNNFIDRGDYIELKEPIGSIRMIQKDWIVHKPNWLSPKYETFDWETALDLAERLDIGGFNDWRIPTIEEFKIIDKIKDVCEIKKSVWFASFWSISASFWAISIDNTEYHWTSNFCNGHVTYPYESKIETEAYVRCVR